MRLLPLVLIAILLTPAAVAAGGDACTCRNLETLQKEIIWAEYMRAGYLAIAAKMEAIEAAVDAENARDNQGIPPDQQSRIDPTMRTGPVWDQEIATLARDQPPGTSPGAHIVVGTCHNGEGEYARLLNDAPCTNIGKAFQKHEDGHIATCTSIGAAPYHLRRHSVKAQEEAASYAEQGKAMRNELKRVLDNATIEIESEMKPVLEGHGMRLVYKYVIERSPVEGRSTPDSERWTLRGAGERIGTIESVRIPGMSCKPTGRLTDAVTMALELDGFTMDLGMSTVSTAGDVGLKCTVPGAGSGFGQSMRPMGEGGSGTVFTGEPVQLETTHSAEIAAGPMGAVMQGSGMTLSGLEITSVKITCPAP